MSRSRFAGVALFTLTTACFGEAPGATAGSQGESSSSGPSQPTTGESESSTVADPSSSSSSGSESSTDPSTTGSDDTSGDPDTSSDSTGAPFDCECPKDAVECESFEDGFDVEELPWGVPGGVAPTVVDDPVHCGAAALRAAVVSADHYSVASHVLPMELLEPGVHSIRAWVQVEGKCLDTPTRLLQIQRVGPAPGFQFSYGIDLFADAENVELRLQDGVGQHEPTSVPFALALETWYELELEFELSASPPVVTLRIDGEAVLDTILGPPATILPMNMLLRTSLGVFQISPFTQSCAATYDDFSAR